MLLSLSDPFIKRPILTTVCSLVILLAGAIALPILPIEKLPQMAPTQIKVTSSYSGADAKTTEDTVTTPIEREINGVENMRYMSSNTGTDGSSNITVAFPTAIDRNQAQVNVQNRVTKAQPTLPDVIKQTGVTVEAASPNILLAFGFYSDKDPDGKPRYNTEFISNYIDLFIIDEIKRIYGVGQASIFGERKYAMRIWLNPNLMAARGLTATDVVQTIEEQNIQVGAGRIGQEPAPSTQQFSIPLRAIGRFRSVEEAENLVIKVGEGGALIRIKDVGRVELGSQNYDVSVVYNGNPGIGLGIYQLPGTNALDTARAIKDRMAALEKAFPPGLKVAVAFDTTLFINVSINDVTQNTFDAIYMAIITILIFLQDIPSTIIPALAMPVAMIGALALVAGFGFSLNQLTLFGIILAIGTVTDDAVVIVEAIKVKIGQGMKSRDAALEAMEELSGPTVASALTQLAVFIPVTFFPGTTGIVYRQFAITLSAAIIFSTFNALTFSPTMAALLLRPEGTKPGILGRIFNLLFGWFFNLFNMGFAWILEQYSWLLRILIKIKPIVLIIFTAGLIFTGYMYQVVPSGFIPEEDQGFIFVIGESPAGVSLQYNEKQVEQVANILKDFPDIQNSLGLAGFGFDGNGYNKYLFFVRLKDWSDRPTTPQSVFALLRKINGRFAKEVTGSRVFAVNAPPVDGLSATGGFEFQLQNRSQIPTEDFIAISQKMMKEAGTRPELAAVFTQFTPGAPQMSILVDRDQAKALNINLDDIYRTLQIYLGANYVNDFVLGKRQYRVYVQADSSYRQNPADINKLYVRSQDNKLIPLGNLIKTEDFVFPPNINHYNVYESIKLQGLPAAGYSSGQAIKAMEEVAAQVLPSSVGYEWTGTALEEKSAGSAAIVIFGLAFVLIFLVLSAQYESYIDPLIIMLTVPLSTLGALIAIWLRANILQAGGIWPVMSNDLYAQVGLLMLIGMASKNAILIVECANEFKEQGMSIIKSAMSAGEQRFRPIIMTAASGLIGYIPLMQASGAGAISRWSIGTVSFGGYLIATILSLGFAPILYVVIKTLEAQYLLPPKPLSNVALNGGSLNGLDLEEVDAMNEANSK